MKILIVSPFLPPRVGGIERHSLELAKALQRLGHKISFLTSKFNSGMGVVNDNFDIYLVPSQIILGRLPIPIINRSTIGIFGQINKSNFDLVIIQSHLFPLSVLGGQPGVARVSGLAQHRRLLDGR
jgi:glycosyltransferase involved in cell wall biosynthesis